MRDLLVIKMLYPIPGNISEMHLILTIVHIVFKESFYSWKQCCEYIWLTFLRMCEIKITKLIHTCKLMEKFYFKVIFSYFSL